MGFASRLFPWARCRVFARDHGVPTIAPMWFRPGFGKLLRGGIELDSFWQIFYSGLFRSHPNEIPTWAGFLLTLRCQKISDRALDSANCQQDVAELKERRDVLLVFSGDEEYFAPLIGHSEYIHAELKRVARPRFLKQVDDLGELPIVLNIRFGTDFPDPVIVDGQLKRGHKTPLPWFIESLRHIRAAAGYDVPAMIVSDAPTQALNALFELPNVRLLRPTSPMSDLLAVARAKVLLASGSSTFSAWGAWLGQMPAISHPGQPLLGPWRFEAEKGQVVVEFDPARPHPGFLTQVRGIFRG